MRKAFKHTGVLLMTAVVGLSIIGAAYALWYEDLQFKAQVVTGSFNVDWSKHDEGTKPVVGILPEGQEVPKWLVGNEIPAGKAPECKNAVITSNAQAANDVGDDNVIFLEAFGVYPYAGCQWLINIHNKGTVPAHIQVFNVGPQNCSPLPVGPIPAPPGAPTPNNCGSSPVVMSIGPGSYWGGTTPPDCDLDPVGPACPSDLTAIEACRALFSGQEGGSIRGLQLHTSNELYCEIRLTLKQDANAEADRYGFTIQMKAHQWNEDQLP